MKVLVTGGAGFIGSALVRALLARGDSVRVLDDLSTGHERNLAGLGVELRRADVRDAAAVEDAVAGMDAVVHEAAQVSVPRSVEDPAETRSVNVDGTRTLLDACVRAGVPRFVQASSCAVYGDSGRPVQVESDPPAPESPYAASKLEAERLAAEAARRHGLAAVSLRYFNVYGPRQDPASAYAAVVPAFAARIARGEAPTIHGDGLQSRDLVHVDDVVRANLLALEAAAHAWGGAFNVGTGRAVTILDLAHAIAQALGRDVAPRHDAPRPGDLRHSLASVDLARERLGFTARVDLRSGLASTLHGPPRS